MLLLLLACVGEKTQDSSASLSTAYVGSWQSLYGACFLPGSTAKSGGWSMTDTSAVTVTIADEHYAVDWVDGESASTPLTCSTGGSPVDSRLTGEAAPDEALDCGSLTRTLSGEEVTVAITVELRTIGGNVGAFQAFPEGSTFEVCESYYSPAE